MVIANSWTRSTHLLAAASVACGAPTLTVTSTVVASAMAPSTARWPPWRRDAHDPRPGGPRSRDAVRHVRHRGASLNHPGWSPTTVIDDVSRRPRARQRLGRIDVSTRNATVPSGGDRAASAGRRPGVRRARYGAVGLRSAGTTRPPPHRLDRVPADHSGRWPSKRYGCSPPCSSTDDRRYFVEALQDDLDAFLERSTSSARRCSRSRGAPRPRGGLEDDAAARFLSLAPPIRAVRRPVDRACTRAWRRSPGWRPDFGASPPPTSTTSPPACSTSMTSKADDRARHPNIDEILGRPAGRALK